MSLVLWSGGCDSTLVLHDLARNEGTPDRPVRALTIVHSQVGARLGQARARAKILRRFKGMGLHVEARTLEIRQLGGLQAQPAGLPQPVLWLSSAVLYLSTVEPEKLFTGHVRGDDVWQKSASLNYAFAELCKVAERKGAEWVTPLMDTEKWEVLRRLRKAKLLGLCWWCEAPVGGDRPCGRCHPCLAHTMAEWRLRQEGRRIARTGVRL